MVYQNPFIRALLELCVYPYLYYLIFQWRWIGPINMAAGNCPCEKPMQSLILKMIDLLASHQSMYTYEIYYMLCNIYPSFKAIFILQLILFPHDLISITDDRKRVMLCT